MESLQFSLTQGLDILVSQSVWVKILVFFFLWLLSWLPLAIPIAYIKQWQPGCPLTDQQKLPLLFSLYLVAPLVIWGAIEVGLISWQDCGLGWSGSFLQSLGAGFALGMGGLMVIFSLESALGLLQWQRENLKQLGAIVLPIFLLAIVVGGIEELVFRGFLFQLLRQEQGIWGSAIISSLIFALLHLVWEQKNTTPQLPGLVVMGLVLVLARSVNDGNLGLAWGLHGGWIWFLTCVNSAPLIKYTETAPQWLIGWGGNPIAGLIGLFGLLGYGAILWIGA